MLISDIKKFLNVSFTNKKGEGKCLSNSSKNVINLLNQKEDKNFFLYHLRMLFKKDYLFEWIFKRKRFCCIIFKK